MWIAGYDSWMKMEATVQDRAGWRQGGGPWSMFHWEAGERQSTSPV